MIPLKINNINHMKYIAIFVLSILNMVVLAQNRKNLEPGNRAVDFSLKNIKGESFTLNEINKNKYVVLIVLRGWPEYQCPVCSRQVGSFIDEAKRINEKEASVLLVYPGPAENLKNYATEFSESFSFPENFYFVLDPEYSMVNKYNLRWDAPKETAYPATLVIDKNGKIIFSKISQTHGGRTSVEEVMEVL